jgi:hypothetical protein
VFFAARRIQPWESRILCHPERSDGSRRSARPVIQDAIIDAMIPLEKALRPHIDRLKV